MTNGESRNAGTAAQHSGAPGNRDCVYLAGDPGKDPQIDLADILSKSGLLARADRHCTNPIPLRFGGQALCLWDGEAAHRGLQSASDDAEAISIGGAGVCVSSEHRLYALTLRDPVPRGDRLHHVQAVQRLFAAAALIAGYVGADRLFWPPARLWSPSAPLAGAITSLERLGLPPILHIIGFVEMAQPGSDRGTLRSVGLAEFCDMEIALEHDESLPASELVRRISRLVIHAMVAGPLDPGASVAGLAKGETMTVGQLAAGVLPIRLSGG